MTRAAFSDRQYIHMVLRYGEDPTIRDREGRCPEDMVDAAQRMAAE